MALYGRMYEGKHYAAIGDELYINPSRAKLCVVSSINVIGKWTNIRQVERILNIQILNTPEADPKANPDGVDVRDLELSTRVRNVLLRSNVNTLGDILNHIKEDKWYRVRNLGQAGITEIMGCLKKIGYEELVDGPKLKSDQLVDLYTTTLRRYLLEGMVEELANEQGITLSAAHECFDIDEVLEDLKARIADVRRYMMDKARRKLWGEE